MLSAKIANALADDYIEYNFRQKYDAIARHPVVEQQLDELKAKVEQSQQALVDYERQNAIISISDKENVVEQRMAVSVIQNLTNAQNDRLQKAPSSNSCARTKRKLPFVAQYNLLQHLGKKACRPEVARL